MVNEPTAKSIPLAKIGLWILGILFFPVGVPIFLARLFWKKIKFPEWVKTVCCIGIVLGWFVLLPHLFPGSKSNDASKNGSVATVNSTSTVSNVATSTTVAVSPHQQEIEEIKANLKHAVEESKKLPAQAAESRKANIDDLGDAELLTFTGYATLATNGQKMDDKDVKTLADAFAKQLSQLQIHEFPLMRKQYSDAVATKMWENDVKVRSYGAGNKTLELIAAVFAANANKKTIQQTIEQKVEGLRFTQVNYKWYDGDDQYTYYKLTVPKDGDLVPLAQ